MDDTTLSRQLEALEATLADDWPAASKLIDQLPDEAQRALDVAASQLSSLARRARAARIRAELASAAEAARDAPAFRPSQLDGNWSSEPC